MSLAVSCLVSLVVSILNVGFVDNLMTIWLKAWPVAFCAAFPAILIFAPIVRKLSEAIADDTDLNS
jgi:hypothetical protein